MDGALIPYDEANVHVLSHSLHYGLAVFEGMRCYKSDNGRSAIFRGPEHIRRLFDSAHIVEMQIPFSQEELLKACCDVVRVNRLEECYLRPIAFYGEGEMGLSARGNKVRVAIAGWPWGAYLGEDGAKKGVRLKTSSFVRFHHNSLMPLPRPRATTSIRSSPATRRAATATTRRSCSTSTATWPRAAARTSSSCATAWSRRRRLISVLPGITRDSVMKILRDASIEVVEQIFPRDAVYIADEAFMTGTAAEVTPVRELDDRQIGAGMPGPVTSKVIEVFRNALHGRDARYQSWLYHV